MDGFKITEFQMLSGSERCKAQNSRILTDHGVVCSGQAENKLEAPRA